MSSGSIRLCDLEELLDGEAREGREFRPDPNSLESVFVLRHAGGVRGYVNRCPHVGSPLNWSPDHFLDREREHIVCATHGAVFRIDDGRCIAGPCLGDSLEPVALEVREGMVTLVVTEES